MFDVAQYPQALVPQAGYEKKVSIDDLVASQDFHISRRVEGDESEMAFTLGEEHRLTDDALAQYDERLSVNLLGAGFMIDDTKLKQQKPASNAWDGTPVNIDDFAAVIELVEKSFPACYQASRVHQRPVPYKREFDKKTIADDLQKKLESLQNTAWGRLGEKVMRLEAIVTLEHAPSFANYWHVVMQLQPSAAENVLKNAKTEWRKILLDTIRDEVFRVYLKLEDNDVIPVAKGFFMK